MSRTYLPIRAASAICYADALEREATMPDRRSDLADSVMTQCAKDVIDGNTYAIFAEATTPDRVPMMDAIIEAYRGATIHPTCAGDEALGSAVRDWLDSWVIPTAREAALEYADRVIEEDLPATMKDRAG